MGHEKTYPKTMAAVAEAGLHIISCRRGKNFVLGLSNGMRLSLAVTPSDVRADLNKRAEFRRALSERTA